jgi:hypothetical protein
METVLSYLTVRNYAAYLTVGCLVYGLFVVTRNVPAGRERQVLSACLLVWWAAGSVLLASVLWRALVTTLDALSRGLGRLFNPDHGPLANALGSFHMWRRHWARRFAGQDPYLLRLEEWQRKERQAA